MMKGNIEQQYGSTEKVIQADGHDAGNDDDDSYRTSHGGLCSKLFTHVTRLQAEPIIALYTLTTSVAQAFVQNVIIEKICLEKNNTQEVCTGHLNETLEAEVQSIAAEYLMSLYVLRLIPAMIISLVIGHWSDLHGRKQILLFALTGNIITYVLYCINAIMIEARPIYMVLAAIPAGLTGDYTIMMFGIYSIVRDTTSAGDLLVMISIIDGIEQIGMEIGPLIGAQLYSRLGYVAVFTTSVVLLVACFLYVAIRIKEPQFAVTSWTRSILDFLDFKGILKNVTVLTDKRDGNRKAYIYANLFGIMGVSMCYFGHEELIYLFGRLIFSWDVVMYSYFTVYVGCLQAVGYLIIMPLIVKFFKSTDTVLVVIGTWTGMIWYISTAFVKSVRQLYIVRSMGLLLSFSTVSFRSITLKCVNPTEIGKITAVFSVAQTLGQILGRIVSTQVYVATLHSFPGAYFMLCGGISGLVGVIFGLMYWDIKKKKENDL